MEKNSGRTVVVYPTIFTVTNDCVLAEVPDLEILTEGKDIPDAMMMARDAIGLKIVSMEDDGDPVKTPSELDEIEMNTGTFAGEGKSFLSYVDVDISAYRRKLENQSFAEK
ncbi:MAG: type II toxin-antitoxin system HicB family antitoxin [Lachnospiraceae bacterium]